MKKMDLKELQDYLGITDNESYLYKYAIIGQFRDIEKLIENMQEYNDLEIILKEDYYNLKLDYKIVYEYKNLIVYLKERKTETENNNSIVYILKLYSKYDYEINEILGIYTTEKMAIEQQKFFEKTIMVEEFKTAIIKQELNQHLQKEYLEKYYLY